MRYFITLCISFTLLLTGVSSAQIAIPESARNVIAKSEVTVSVISNGKEIKILGVADGFLYGQSPTTSTVLINAYSAPYASNFSITANGRSFSGRSFMFDLESGAALIAFDNLALSPSKAPASFYALELENEYIVSSLDTDNKPIMQVARMVGISQGRTLLSRLKAPAPTTNGNVYTMTGEWVGFVQREGAPNDGYIYVANAYNIETFENFAAQLSIIWFNADPDFKKINFLDFMQWARITVWDKNLTLKEWLSVDRGFLSSNEQSPNVKAIANKIRQDFRTYASETAKQQIYLDCFIQTSDGTRSELDIHVDLVAKTANGWPAQINDAKISFVPRTSKTGVTVNRYTGSISVDKVADEGVLRRGENVATGNCQPRGKDRKF